MKKSVDYRAAVSGVLAVLASMAVCAQPARTATVATPAEINIELARKQIANQPDHVPAYNSLAMAYARRGRETSDSGYGAKAEETLERSLKLEPGNFAALRVETFLMLGRHEFAEALEEAAALHKRVPDDLDIRGYLADANEGLGNYDDAVDEVQAMLNLRPGNLPGIIRAANLRELHGDLAGALEWMHKAFDSTPVQESADRAWLFTRISRLQLLSGNLPEAETYASEALGLFPDYHHALLALAQVRLAQNRSDEAVALLERLYAAVPRAANLFALAEALNRAGRKGDADKDFREFDRKALGESGMADNANRELALYYADYAHEPTQALRIITQELARRHDVFTLDAYAWSLAASGEYVQADAAMKKALAFGSRDPQLLRHAGEIERHLPGTAPSR